ncbi:MAG: LuxR C-terminal-related transcriptional regulator [Bacteroidales bacterium]
MHTKKDTYKTFFTRFQQFDFIELVKLWGSRIWDKPIEIKKFAENIEKNKQALINTHTYVLITDLKIMKFLYVSPSIKNVTGYAQDEFLKGGVSMFMEKYCPADRANGMKILYNIISHQKWDDVNEKQLYQYITTFRFLKKDGYYAFMHNRMVFMTYDERNRPNILLSIVSNIESFFANDNLTFARLKFDLKSGKYRVELKETHIVDYLNILNEKDLKILKYIANGLDNSQIALEMKLKEQTIKDYRKKMLGKTWCNNTAELITFALRNQLI